MQAHPQPKIILAGIELQYTRVHTCIHVYICIFHIHAGASANKDHTGAVHTCVHTCIYVYISMFYIYVYASASAPKDHIGAVHACAYM